MYTYYSNSSNIRIVFATNIRIPKKTLFAQPYLKWLSLIKCLSILYIDDNAVHSFIFILQLLLGTVLKSL